MTLALLAVIQRSPTRIRLLFDGPLALGAFGAAGLPLYLAAESYDGAATPGRTWAVIGALAVATDATAVELALSAPATDGAWFWVIFSGPVPAVDDTPFANAASPTIRLSEAVPPPSPELPQNDLDAVLWGEDIVWNGSDWVESAEGDLDVIRGIANAGAALERRLVSEGLAWDPSYGLKPRRFVDAPAIMAPAIRGEAQEQMVADDRVVAAAASVATEPNEPEQIILVDTTFFSGDTQRLTAPLG